LLKYNLLFGYLNDLTFIRIENFYFGINLCLSTIFDLKY